MRVALVCLSVVIAACGAPRALSEAATSSLSPAAGSPAPTPPQTPARAAVEPLARAVPFEIYLPATLRPDLPVTASLRAAVDPKDVRAGLGDPVLSIEVSAVPGGKPALYLSEGPEGCCPDFGAPVTPKVVMVRATPKEVRGEFFPAHSATGGARLRYSETSSNGSRTTIVMTGWSFGPYATEEALLELASSMRGFGRQAPSDTRLVYYSTHVSHSPTGHRISVAIRSGGVPEAARLIDTAGREVASATFETPRPYDCLRAAAAVAAMPVKEQETQEIGRGSLRVELRISGVWVRTQLVASNCASVE